MSTSRDELVEAIDGVVEALGETCEETAEVAERADALRRHRARGLPVSDLAGTEQGRIVVHMSALLAKLNGATTRLRRAHAKAMRDEGATTERIADVLGVTRQRVSALLRTRPDPS